jgi:hypothetical protein
MQSHSFQYCFNAFCSRGQGCTRSLIFEQRVFRNELPAQTSDAHGAALCLAPAINLESDEIVEWLSGEIVRTPLAIQRR